MHVLILTLGSHGDVQPFVALARGLQAAGHRATLCAPRHFEGFVGGHGVAYAPMDNGFVELLSTLETRAAVEDMGSLPGALRTLWRLMPQANALQRKVFDDAWAAARAARPDLLLFHSKLAAAPDIAHALGVPAVMALLFPQFARTGDFPAVGLPNLPGRALRRGSYSLVHAIAGRVSRKPVMAWREAAGLGPRPRGLGLLSMPDGAPIPLLHGTSPALCPPPSDWPAHALAFGDWPLDDGDGFTPDPALQGFLDAGPPPVYVGFGSMAGRNPEKKAAIVLEALRLAGVRALIGRGWGGLAPADLPPTVHAIGHVPHGWLFPRVAAVVHHGGAGTTHAGLRAGRPTVVCPFFGDQPFWGRRVHALGAGPAPVPQKKLDPPRVAAAITAATTDPAIARAAATLGERLRAETGVADAVRWLVGFARA